ncbi:hypothetical protein Z517_03280 [Fonsecaea pedrosoi CBS 271.37]|uniref:NmrA-like domain-containing protein n=1 Tax=Fonsecaea pedrosoi CBS 271.37 TaxID=1442368 RepID=A0A0D2HI07_9EURO|nr:uncharacterized protein Z517_03280 [Fonsecaea pedrosoi CBS 271.37]KIW84034.1 hypothetical protein Z517_03280 [Fonsecaea pedrosoi CBS 271.37]
MAIDKANSTIKTVALCGASGFVGQAILKALSDSGRFDVTVLTRSVHSNGNGHVGNDRVQYKQVDYDSVDSLTDALRAQDAVVSAIGKGDTARIQHNLIDAAVAAGVKHFIPSEFGADLKNKKISAFPIYKGKVALEAYLEEAASKSRLIYTYVYNNVILDFGLRVGSILDFKTNTIRIYDGGAHKFSTSTLSTISQAVVQILLQPEKFSNRPVRISEVAISQQHLLEIAKKLEPSKEWTVISVDSAQLVRDVQEEAAKGIFSLRVFNAYAIRGAFAPDFGCLYGNNDNKALGISELTERELEQYLARFVRQ